MDIEVVRMNMAWSIAVSAIMYVDIYYFHNRDGFKYRAFKITRWPPEFRRVARSLPPVTVFST